MRTLALIPALLLLPACGHKDDRRAEEPYPIVGAVSDTPSVEVQSSGSIYHINLSDLESVRERGHNGDKAAVEQLINYYMFSADGESDNEILRNLTRWLDKGVSLGVAGADQKLLVVASESVGPPCSRIRQIIERLPKNDRVNFPRSTYTQSCLRF